MRASAGRSSTWARFSGGGQPVSHWITRDDILGLLRRHGLGELRLGFDEPDHPNGPALALVARRTGVRGAPPATCGPTER